MSRKQQAMNMLPYMSGHMLLYNTMYVIVMRPSSTYHSQPITAFLMKQG